MDFEISGPGPGRPSGAWVNSEHIGHLALFINAVEEERGTGKDRYPVAACEYVVCLTESRAWEGADVGGKALAPRILSADKNIVCVRLNQAEATKEGFSPTTIADDPLPIEIAQAQQALGKYGAKMPSGRVIFDVVAFNQDNAPPEPPI